MIVICNRVNAKVLQKIYLVSSYNTYYHSAPTTKIMVKIFRNENIEYREQDVF